VNGARSNSVQLPKNSQTRSTQRRPIPLRSQLGLAAVLAGLVIGVLLIFAVVAAVRIVAGAS
jgi:hypothetical protein